MQNGGSFYSKKERKMFQENRPFLFSVEDPGDRANDIARNSYGAQKVLARLAERAPQLNARSGRVSLNEILDATAPCDSVRRRRVARMKSAFW